MTRAMIAAWLGLLAGACAPTAAPPPLAPPQRVASQSAAPSRPAPPAAPAPVAALVAPVLQEPLGRPSRAIERVALPSGAREISVLQGTPSGLYAVTTTNEVFEVGEAKAKSLGGPKCKEPYWGGSTIEPVISAVVLGKSGLELWGQVGRVARGTWYEAYGVKRVGGTWRCAAAAPPFRVEWMSTYGGTRWYLTYDSLAVRVERDGGVPPLPSNAGSIALDASGPTRAWVAQIDQGELSTSLYQFNGLVWAKRPAPPMSEVLSMFEDERESLWVLGASKGGADRLAKWDGSLWSLVPVPADFSAVALEGTGSDNLWVFGPKTWYALEDGKLTSIPAPFEAKATFRSDAGEIWVGGADLTKPVVDEQPAGALARIVAKPKEVKP